MPYGMEHPAYLEQVADQAAQLPRGIARVVVPVGSGITLAAMLRGLCPVSNPATLIGVRVGGTPTPALDRYAPGWGDRVELVSSPAAYGDAEPNRLGELVLDPDYEVKVRSRSSASAICCGLWVCVPLRRSAGGVPVSRTATTPMERHTA